MALTWADNLQMIRDLVQDTSTVNQGLSDALLLRLNNEVLQQWGEAFGDRVSWDGATAAGTTWANDQAGVTRKLTGPTTYTKIYGAYAETDGTVTLGRPLEKIELHLMLDLQINEGTSGVPFYWAAERAATTTPASVGKWYIYTYPLHAGGYVEYISLRARKALAAMTTGTDAYDMTDSEARLVGRITAAHAAPLLNRYNLIDHIWRDVPEYIQAVMRRKIEATTPVRRPAEAPL